MVAHLGDAARGDGTEDYGCLILEGGRLGSLPEGVGGTASSEAIATAASRGACCPLSLRGEQTRGHAQCSLTACYAEEPRLILAQMGQKPPRSSSSNRAPWCGPTWAPSRASRADAVSGAAPAAAPHAGSSVPAGRG